MDRHCSAIFKPLRTMSAVVAGSVISNGTARTVTSGMSAESPSSTNQPSRIPTFAPVEASASARFAVAVDFPTPPFPEAMATTEGLARMLAGVNTYRSEAYRQMLAHGFRSDIQGIAMHKPNKSAYHHSGVYVIDDWR